MTKREYQRLADNYLIEINNLKIINEMLSQKYNNLLNGKDNMSEILTDMNNDLQYALDKAELKNNVLLEALGNDNTKLFNYNGEIYGLKEITYNTHPDRIDTLSVEMTKTNVKVEPRNDGLFDSLNRVVSDIGSQLNKIL